MRPPPGCFQVVSPGDALWGFGPNLRRSSRAGRPRPQMLTAYAAAISSARRVVRRGNSEIMMDS